MYRDVMPPPSDGPLKNGPEMMASEGVVSALFFRLASDVGLRETYREPAFYEPFLLPGEVPPATEADLRALIPPAENVYLKLFDVLHRQFAWGEWPAIELVRGYATRFPDEAAAVYGVYLSVTRGVTVERDASVRHAEPRFLAGIRERLLAGQARIDGNIGPALWLVAPGTEFGMGLFRYFAVPNSWTFDLNAADEVDLRSVSGVSPALASAIVRDRDERGFFASVDGLSRVPGMTTGLVEQFRAMRARMEERMKKTPERQSDSTFMKNYIVLVLKGAYYAAAVWQFGRALVVAGLGVALLWALFGLRARGPAGSNPPPRRRAWWRRSVRALGRGMGAAAVPLLISAGIYAAGVVPGVGTMAIAGAAWGVAIAAVVLWRHKDAAGLAFRATRLASGAIVASLIIGAMYWSPLTVLSSVGRYRTRRHLPPRRAATGSRARRTRPFRLPSTVQQPRKSSLVNSGASGIESSPPHTRVPHRARRCARAGRSSAASLRACIGCSPAPR